MLSDKERDIERIEDLVEIRRTLERTGKRLLRMQEEMMDEYNERNPKEAGK